MYCETLIVIFYEFQWSIRPINGLISISETNLAVEEKVGYAVSRHCWLCQETCELQIADAKICKMSVKAH
jgi:hypothetical protein